MCGLLLLVSLLAAPTAAAQERPATVTDSLVEIGSMIFHDRGGCADCHGGRGSGSELGPSLRDSQWMSGSGTYGEILEAVLHGKPRSETESGEPMPMRGVSELRDNDVRAVVAYVWAISHPQR